MFSHVWGLWKVGAKLGVLSFFCVLVIGIPLLILGFLLGSILGLPEDTTVGWWRFLWPVWAPVGLGIAAREFPREAEGGPRDEPPVLPQPRGRIT